MSIFSNLVHSALDGDVGQLTAKAANLAAQAQKARTSLRPTAKAAKIIGSVARKAENTAAQASRIAGRSSALKTFDNLVIDPIVNPVSRVARGVGRVAGATGRGAGHVAGAMGRHPKAWGVAAGVAGGVWGVGSGLRDSARDINSQIGDPVGSYASLSVRTAFTGNPQNSRSSRGGASGNITLNSRR